jgi:hypothetical protein
MQGKRLHTWQQGPKGADGLTKYRCVICDFIGFAVFPKTPDPDPNRPCPARQGYI